MEKIKTKRLFAILNIAGFIVTVIFNALANALPLNGKDTGELSDAYPNLFVPAGLTFSIWGLIYLLLAGFVVYQIIMAFRTDGDSGFMEKIGPWFLISSAANALWIIAWHWEQVLLSVLIMLALLASLIIIYVRINSGNDRPKPAEYLFVRHPFSVYLGWITVAPIANITALLVDADWNRFGLGEQFWTVFVLAAAVLITLLVLIRRKDTA